MKKVLVVTCLMLISMPMLAKSNIKKLNWEGVEVVWLEDDRFPTYDVVVHFADGALSDSSAARGETNAMFGLLDAGTRRFNQKEISENLEFFGTQYGFNVTHEYSTFEVSGLVKDINPTMKLVCHLFKDSIYPKKELSKEKRRVKNSLRNLSSSHSGLASRVFREISLKDSPYSYPVGGKIKDLKRWNSKSLKNKLNYFNDNVRKKIYLAGPKQVLDIEHIITKECGWTAKENQIVRSENYTPVKKSEKATIYLVPVKNANQAQVRIGRFINKNEFNNFDLLEYSSSFLGGGFTSRLMREVRVKRGLTYSVGAFAGMQKDYGRCGISTFTKNKSIKELLDVIKATVDSVATGNFEQAELERSRGFLVGSHPFRFEERGAYLSQLVYMDHVGRKYDELYTFPERIKKISKEQVVSVTKDLFNWGNMSIVVVGSRSLLGELKKIGSVKIVPYKDYL